MHVCVYVTTIATMYTSYRNGGYEIGGDIGRRLISGGKGRFGSKKVMAAVCHKEWLSMQTLPTTLYYTQKVTTNTLLLLYTTPYSFPMSPSA